MVPNILFSRRSYLQLLSSDLHNSLFLISRHTSWIRLLPLVLLPSILPSNTWHSIPSCRNAWPSTCAFDMILCLKSFYLLGPCAKFPHSSSCPSNWFSPQDARSTFQRLPVYFYLPVHACPKLSMVNGLRQFNECFQLFLACGVDLDGLELDFKAVMLSLCHNCDSTAIRLRHDYDEKLTCSFFARVESRRMEAGASDTSYNGRSQIVVVTQSYCSRIASVITALARPWNTRPRSDAYRSPRLPSCIKEDKERGTGGNEVRKGAEGKGRVHRWPPLQVLIALPRLITWSRFQTPRTVVCALRRRKLATLLWLERRKTPDSMQPEWRHYSRRYQTSRKIATSHKAQIHACPWRTDCGNVQSRHYIVQFLFCNRKPDIEWESLLTIQWQKQRKTDQNQTSCGARHNKPRLLLPPSEWYWLVNASPLSNGRW